MFTYVALVGRSWPRLGLLGALWASFFCILGCLGPFLGHRGPHVGALERSWEHFAPDVGRLGELLGALGALFGSLSGRNPQGAWVLWAQTLEPPPPERLPTEFR